MEWHGVQHGVQRRLLTMFVVAVAVLLLAACGGGGEDGVASLGGDSASADGTDGDAEQGAAEQDAEGTPEEQILAYNQCLREQGIDVPDPSVDSEGNVVFEQRLSSEDDDTEGQDQPGLAFNREDFERAREVCGDPPAAVFGGSGDIDETELADALLEFAQCMRDNGVDVPDPDLSELGPGGPPVTSRSGDGPAEGDDDGGVDGGESEDGGDDESEDGGPAGNGPQLRVAGPFGELDLSDPDVQTAFETCQEAGILPGPGVGTVAGDGSSGGRDAGGEDG
jgi:hypothetical protein